MQELKDAAVLATAALKRSASRPIYVNNGSGMHGRHDCDLAHREHGQPERDPRDPAVGVQADAELVDAPPRPGDDDVAQHGEARQPALADHLAPAGVQHDGVPQHDHQRAVLLGSQPQKRPHESSAHRPPSTVPTKLKKIAKHSVP